MPLQLVVRDYLAVHEAKMLVKGLTILKGESFQGKSSLIRALRDAFTNSFTSSCVRWGADIAEIKVLFPGNRLLRITRTSKGATQMQFDGETYEKIGRVVPEVIASFLNLGQVKFGAEQYNLNFYDQFQPPLLLSCSHKRLAELLSSSSALSDLTLLQKAVDNRKTELKGSFATLDGLMSSVKTQMSAQSEYLGKATPVATKLRDSYVQLNKAENLVKNLSYLEESLQEQANLDALHVARTTAFTRIEELSYWCLKEADSLRVVDLFNELHFRIAHTEKAKSADAVLSDLLDELLHVERIDALLDSVNSVDFLNFRAARLETSLDILKKIDEMVYLVDGLNTNIKDAGILAESINVLASLEPRIEELRHRTSAGVCPLCGKELIDEDMTRQEVEERRKQLEEQLRQDEKTAAVLRSRISQLSEQLGLKEPTIEQLKKLQAESRKKIVELESAVQTSLTELDNLEAV